MVVTYKLHVRYLLEYEIATCEGFIVKRGVCMFKSVST